jgi:UDP-galactopyranose mutase
MDSSFDYLIVGAGFAGLVMAERLTTVLGKRVLVVEKRNHIGGNSQDEIDEAGVLVHKYGPHYFRTNSAKILNYLSQFTDWIPVAYEIKSFSEGRYWSFPINLNTFEELIGRPSTSDEFSEWLEREKLHISNPKNSEEIITSQVGLKLYRMFFEGYTLKQWKIHPRNLDSSVCGRIPIRTNRDNRYLKEAFQCLPKNGYHKLFKNMVRSMGANVKILLNTDYRDILQDLDIPHIIYTGPIDSYFQYAHGPLPYRSLRFERESFDSDELNRRIPLSGKKGFWQPAMQVNYPNDEAFTRIVEIKHATGQKCENTTIVREFPEDFKKGKDPYYPIPNPESAAIYQRYKEMAQQERNVTFLGRLATYKYYNMDQVVGMALSAFQKLKAALD